MTIQERLIEARQQEVEAVALHQRSITAVEMARDGVIAARARVALLEELLKVSTVSDGG